MFRAERVEPRRGPDAGGNLMTMITEIVVHTPVWVWLILAYLLFMGVRSLWPRTVGFTRLAIMPAVFFVWGLWTLFETFRLTPLAVGLWVVGLVIGGAIGATLVARLSIGADRERGLLHMPGSPVNLVLIILIFVTKYYFGVRIGMAPDLVRDPGFVAFDLGISGILTGIFLGRFYGYWRKLQTAPAGSPA
ncbi:MAG TPA: DUF6622 family protein [Hyphomicrobiales bacterium]|nr:DUF6622 family protein [Hyphomicrobiales bacterium]